MSETENTGTVEQKPGDEQSPARLPDDHPLVKAYAATKEKLDKLRESSIDPDELKRLKELDESTKSEAQKREEAHQKLVRENETLKTQVLRSEVAAAKGVPARLLTGSTKEDIEAAADALLEFKGLKRDVVPPASTSTNNGSGVSTELSADEIVKKVASRR